MAARKVVSEWLAKADEDRAFADACLEEELSFFGQICFFFQQSAEKYLKAYIVAHDLEFRKIHDLIELLAICRTRDPALAGSEADCRLLNRFYVDTRYPAHWPSDFTITDAKSAQEAAGRISQAIKSKLNAP